MNIGNSTLKEISELLLQADRIALYPHVNMDGDAIGSCIAISEVLNALGKECKIIVSENIPENLRFLDEESTLCVNSKDFSDIDVSLLVDCGELKRIPGRESHFNSAVKTACIDHHGTTEAFCHYNYIDPDEAATGQIAFQLINTLVDDMDNNDALSLAGKRKVANALFAAITTDTGDFQYSNTQKKSHEIVAKLYEWGLEANKVSIEIYESNRVERLKLTAEVLSKMKLLCDNKVAIAYCSQEMLRNIGARMEETEWIAGSLRGIKGVEVAIFLKEEEAGRIKTSLRSKSFYDVAMLASEYGGGGHIRASGYTAEKGLDEALMEIETRIAKDFT